MIEALIEANVEHARAAARIAEILQRLEVEAKEGRKVVVEEIKAHVTAHADVSDRRLRNLVAVGAVIIILAQAVGAAAERFLALVKP